MVGQRMFLSVAAARVPSRTHMDVAGVLLRLRNDAEFQPPPPPVELPPKQDHHKPPGGLGKRRANTVWKAASRARLEEAASVLECRASRNIPTAHRSLVQLYESGGAPHATFATFLNLNR